jgi:hypothetical protein
MTKEQIKITKRIAKIAGNILTLASIVFVLYKITKLNIDFSTLINPRLFYLSIILLIVLLAICHISSYLWYLTLKLLSGDNINFAESMEINIKAVVQRYIPGNIMHYVGRNLLGLNYNIDQICMGISTIIEISIYCLVCILLSIFAGRTFIFSIVRIGFSAGTFFIIMAVVILGLIGFCIFFISVRCKSSIYFNKIKRFFSKNGLFIFWGYCTVYTIHHFVGGVYLFCIIKNVMADVSFLPVLTSLIIASFVGTITPGAPGGLGVKEAIFIMLIGNPNNSDIIIKGMLMHRFITICSDILVYPVYKLLIKKILPVEA